MLFVPHAPPYVHCFIFLAGQLAIVSAAVVRSSKASHCLLNIKLFWEIMFSRVPIVAQARQEHGNVNAKQLNANVLYLTHPPLTK